MTVTADSGTAARVRVLVADDSAFMRRMLAGIPKQRGFDVVGEARDGDEAIRLSLLAGAARRGGVGTDGAEGGRGPAGGAGTRLPAPRVEARDTVWAGAARPLTPPHAAAPGAGAVGGRQAGARAQAGVVEEVVVLRRSNGGWVELQVGPRGRSDRRRL